MSAYNLFMKKEIPAVKRAHPNLSHQEAFKLAARNWSKKHSPSKSLGLAVSKKTRKGRKGRKGRKSRKSRKGRKGRRGRK